MKRKELSAMLNNRKLPLEESDEYTSTASGLRRAVSKKQARLIRRAIKKHRLAGRKAERQARNAEV